MPIKPALYTRLFRHINRSMTGQLTLMTLLFVIGFIVALVYNPVVEYLRIDTTSLAATKRRIIDEMYSYERYQAEHKLLTTKFTDLEYIAEVLRYNKDFRYYIHTRKWAESNWDGAFTAKLRFDEVIDVLLSSKLYNDICLNLTSDDHSFVDPSKKVSSFAYCNDKYSILEIEGVTVPVPYELSFFDLAGQWLWDKSYRPLVAACGVFLIALTSLFLFFRSISRLAISTQTLDSRNFSEKLPEDRVPYEALPLVRAVNDMIERVRQSKTEQDFFLAAAAHEMRTPLTIIRTRAELLDDSTLKSELISDVQNISRMVNQLLRLMRSRGAAPIDTPVDIIDICKQVIMDRAPLAIDRGVMISFDNHMASLQCNGDAELLFVMMANIVDNAISLSPRGSEVKVVFHANQQLDFIDQGPGIAPELLNFLFKPFSKYPTNRQGHGLGLAIVKSIADLHHFRVFASNNPTQGATFSIRFKTDN